MLGPGWLQNSEYNLILWYTGADLRILGGGGSVQEFSKGGGVQVRGNFHTNKQKKPLRGKGFKPP